MLFHTHILLGIVLFLLTKDFFSGGNVIAFFLLVLLGSVLPDIDERSSKICRWSGILGGFVAFFSKHRGFFHSIVFHLILFVVMAYFFNRYYAAGLLVGYFAHLLGDIITPAGLAIFYPFSKFKIRGPVRCGGFWEGVIMVMLVVLVISKLF